MKKDFNIVIALDKRTVFEIAYHTVGGNKSPYFSTSASKFNRIYTDYTTCGQAQDSLLPKDSAARAFWKKWDCEHLNELSDEKLQELRSDVEELKKRYKAIETTGRDISFNEIRDFLKWSFCLPDPYKHINEKITKTGDRDYMFTVINKRTNARYVGEWHGPKKPEKIDLLQAMAWDAQAADMKFVDFVPGYGYNDQLEKAEDIYNKCKESARGLRDLGIDYKNLISE